MSRKIEDDFCDFWNERHPDMLAITEFRPQRYLYDTLNPKMPYKQWLKTMNFADYRADFALEDYHILGEWQGSGTFSHADAGATRDMLKNNQYLQMGYITLKLPVQTVKSSQLYVEDMILELIDVWYKG